MSAVWEREAKGKARDRHRHWVPIREGAQDTLPQADARKESSEEGLLQGFRQRDSGARPGRILGW